MKTLILSVFLLIALACPARAGDYVLVVIEAPPVAPVFVDPVDEWGVARKLTKDEQIIFDCYLSDVSKFNAAAATIKKWGLTGKIQTLLDSNPPQWTKDGKTYNIYSIESRRFREVKTLNNLIVTETSKIVCILPVLIVRLSSPATWLWANGYRPLNEAIK